MKIKNEIGPTGGGGEAVPSAPLNPPMIELQMYQSA